MKTNKVCRIIGSVLLLAQIVCLFLPFYRVNTLILDVFGFNGEENQEINLSDYTDMTDLVGVLDKDSVTPLKWIIYGATGGADKLTKGMEESGMKMASGTVQFEIILIMLMFIVPLLIQICGGIFGLTMRSKIPYIVFSVISFVMGAAVLLLNIGWYASIKSVMEQAMGDSLTSIESAMSSLGIKQDLVSVFISAGIGFYVTLILDVLAFIMAIVCGVTEKKAPAYIAQGSQPEDMQIPFQNAGQGMNMPQPGMENAAGMDYYAQPGMENAAGMDYYAQPGMENAAGTDYYAQPGMENAAGMDYYAQPGMENAAGMDYYAQPGMENAAGTDYYAQPGMENAADTPLEPKGIMRGLCGMYAGAEIPLDENAIVIGRDASKANLIYDESCTKVSRKHCELSYDSASKMFSIIDYSSTGTFKNGNTNCLPQNMRVFLEPGSVIDIGDETNRFILE